MDGSQVKVECSPNTFRRLQTDENYRNEITQKVMESQDPNFIPNILVSEVPGTVNIPEEEAVMSKEVWLEAPTKLLLSLMEEMGPKVGKTFELKNKTKMWQRIHSKLAEEGYAFTVAQVQGKYRSLERKYKETKLHNSKTGRNRKTCPYESELDKVLGEKRGLYPEFVLDSESVEGISRQQLMSNSDGNTPSTSEDSYSPTLKRRKNSDSVQERMLKKMDLMETNKEAYRAKILKRLDHREEIDRKRNDMLAIIVAKLSE